MSDSEEFVEIDAYHLHIDKKKLIEIDGRLVHVGECMIYDDEADDFAIQLIYWDLMFNHKIPANDILWPKEKMQRHYKKNPDDRGFHPIARYQKATWFT